MFRVPDFFAALSRVLYAALAAVGVNSKVVSRRRETYLRREIFAAMTSKLNGINSRVYHFGSQSEGTTTPGLHSDTDTLYTDENINIMYNISDWKRGMTNYLMVKDETTPVQHYLLQLYRSDVPQPATVRGNHDGLVIEY